MNTYVKFQFPSNGKVCSKREVISVIAQGDDCFNSLQTGKCVASVALIIAATITDRSVSIPFKRESV